MADTIYCYPDSDVLKNKLGIQDRERLRDFERRLTMLRLMELIAKPLKGRFDFEHLKNIHHYIFQDIYEWAGESRKVDIGKGNMFCNAMFIDSQAEELFSKLQKESYIEGLSFEEFTNRLAFYFSEINALHPFREGNGRTQREFIRSLAIHNGYTINFALVTEMEMLKASQDSFLCDYESMEQLFKKCIKKKK